MRKLFGPIALSMENRLDALQRDNMHLQKTVTALHEKIAKLEWILKLVYNRLDLLRVSTRGPPATPANDTITPLPPVINLDEDHKVETRAPWLF